MPLASDWHPIGAEEIWGAVPVASDWHPIGTEIVFKYFSHAPELDSTRTIQSACEVEMRGIIPQPRIGL